MTQTPILELQDIRKYFGGVKAVDGVTFSINAGEVHAIVGENGAGKSTLMNILAGVYPPNSGRILMHGKPYAPGSPRDARAQGITIVFQELALFPSLPVDANVFIGKELKRNGVLDHRAMRDRAREVLQRMDLDLDVSRTVEELSIGQKQWVEIARALTDNAQVLILDEPNSALNQHETQALFALIQRLKATGITVIYISHRLEEVFQIADRITVMRDGRYIGTWSTAETTISEIVSSMVGREMNQLFDRQTMTCGAPILDVRQLSVPGELESVSLSVRAGEVVGLAGLAGAGITALFEVLFGVRRAAHGQVFLNGKQVQIETPYRAMERQIAMVPSDRRGLGLMQNWSVLNNITISVLSRLSRLGVLNHKKATDLGQQQVSQLDIVTDRLDKGVLYLSGGNQQKVLLARWLATQPCLLILDDPTRGIDVGTKQEIYGLIDHIAASGVAVLLTSSELDEIMALSNRVLVLRKGHLIVDLPHDVCNKGLVMEFVAGDPQKGRTLLEACGQPGAVPMSELPATQAADDASRNLSVPMEPDSVAVPVSSVTNGWARVLRVREIGVLLATLIVGLFFTALTPHFFKLSNLLLVSRQMAILGVIATGMTFVLASGEVDLSVGWSFNLIMSAMAFLMARQHVNPWLALVAGLALGALLGAVNGLLAVSLSLPTIIVTLGTMTLYRGLGLALNRGRTIANLPASSFFRIGTGTLGPVSYMTVIMFAAVVACAWILRKTQFARHLLALGSSAIAAQRVGIRTRRLRFGVMTFNGLMCGIAAVLGLAFLGAADAQSGSGYELSAIASAIMGGAQLGGGSGSAWGTLIGIALIMIIQNGLVLLGLRPAWQIASTGLVIIAAVALDRFIRTRRARMLSPSAARTTLAVDAHQQAQKGGEE